MEGIENTCAQQVRVGENKTVRFLSCLTRGAGQDVLAVIVPGCRPKCTHVPEEHRVFLCFLIVGFTGGQIFVGVAYSSKLGQAAGVLRLGQVRGECKRLRRKKSRIDRVARESTGSEWSGQSDVPAALARRGSESSEVSG